jgi:uncharacterized protein YqeY
MSVIRELDEQIKTAMKAREAATLSALRMAKARLKQHVIDRRIDGELSDEDARQVIGSYVKQLKKAVPEYEKAGAAGAEKLAALHAEIACLEPFLPRLLDEAATREIVARAVEELGRPPLQRSGMVIGKVMKAHGGEVDPLLVRRLVEEALAE